ncbi:periplasmic heavy metal sensor [Fibrella arboris]|uniref:periplasmic heavy metal sensor n=1 Tax=Fibrella arboris TaxID=3242486 RepID=UPI00352237E2
MERTKLLTIAVVGLLLLNLVTLCVLVVRPENRPFLNRPPDRPEPEGPARIIVERLHLDPQQQQQYQELVQAHRKQMRGLTAESVTLVQAYYQLLEADQPNRLLADSLNQQIARNQRGQAQLNFAHFRAIKALCRPDQRADFKQLIGDLSQLFGRQPQAPDRNSPPGPGRPPEGRAGNFPPRP